MDFERRETPDGTVAVLNRIDGPIRDTGDFLDVMASGAGDTLVVRAEHFAPEFFDLKSGILGEILQKVSNYRRKLVIIGDWSGVPAGSLADFIRESNRGGPVVFAEDIDAGLAAVG